MAGGLVLEIASKIGETFIKTHRLAVHVYLGGFI